MFLISCYSITLKNYYSLDIYVWGSSSAGEHMTEDHGVRGSTPRCPILQKVYKKRFSKYSMTEKKGVGYILGILSIVFAVALQPVVAVLLGIIGLVQNREEKSKKAKKLNIIGIVLGVIIFIGLIALNVYLMYKSASQGGFPTY